VNGVCNATCSFFRIFSIFSAIKQPDLGSKRYAVCFLVTAKYAKYAEGFSFRISVGLSIAVIFEAVVMGTQVNGESHR